MKTILASLLLCSLTGCGPATPATFTPRIIDNEDGTYTTQYYWSHPGYINDPNAYCVSIDRARVAAKRWNDVKDHKQVKIVQ